MKILIPTCNKYIHYIEALQYSVRDTYLNSFEFIIIGGEKPDFKLDKNWSFVSMGNSEPANRWSDMMIDFLKDFEDEFFMYGNDDCAVTFIDKERVREAMFVMRYYKDVGRFALMAEGKNRQIAPFFLCDDDCVQPAIRSNQFGFDADYKLSLGWSLYRKDFFLKFCKRGMTPWDFELQSCRDEIKREINEHSVLTFLPDGQAIDGAFFARKNIQGVMPDWHKGYYGHDLDGDKKEAVRQILFKT